MTDLLRRLVDLEETHSKRAQSLTSRLTQTGITELATQLDATQDEFPSVTRVTTWPVMGLLVALLLVIGPIDYLFVHKLLNRPGPDLDHIPADYRRGGGRLPSGGATWSKGDRVLFQPARHCRRRILRPA